MKNTRYTALAGAIAITILAGSSSLRGQSQGFVFSYIVNPNGNQAVANANDTIPFTPVAINGLSTVTFVVHNSLTGSAATNSLTVSGVGVTGSGFAVSGLPLFPAILAPGAELRFTLSLTPASATAVTGALTIALSNSSISFNLQGQGVAPSYAYQFSTDSGPVTVTPTGTITIDPAAVGAASVTSTTLQVTNTGNAAGAVSNISLTTSTNAFTLAQVPGLPATLAPGASLTFAILFAPKTVGDTNATLRVDNAFFTVDATGLGPNVQVSIDTGAGDSVVASTGVVALPNTTVGDKRAMQVSLQNNGNLPATVNAISTSGTGYAVSGLPALPLTLNAGATAAFQITFTPNAVGPLNGTLQVDSQSITLRGVGGTPPAVPAVTINVPTQLQPQQQPTAAITLAAPYPYDLTGVLTMTFTSTTFANDPSLQFANGGRTIGFKIPANTTQALFGSQATPQVLFQAGTISGQLQFVSTFSVQTVDVTPTGSGAPALTATIPAAPPVIGSVTLASKTSTTVQLLVSGYSDTRDLSQMVFTFSGTANSNITSGPLTANVQNAFNAWYQATSSQAYGSQFTASITFNISGDSSSLQSVAVTAANSQGTSTPSSVTLN